VKGFTHLREGAAEPDVDAALAAMQDAPKGSIFILQACCHNPTGVDYDVDQWKRLADVMRRREHFAFFDAAYIGFGSGKADAVEADSWALRYFVEQGIDMLACQSFSKILGLYAERVGALHVVCSTSTIAENVLDQLRAQTRWEVSSTPAYGALLADIIMQDEDLTVHWREELQQAAARVENNRQALYRLLTGKGNTAGSWEHMAREKGLFSFLNLTKAHIQELRETHHVYLPPNGRINVAGLSKANIDRAAEAIDSVITM